MQRRVFIRNIGLGVLAGSMLPTFGSANTFFGSSAGTLVNLGEPLTQIRHGALNLPIALSHNQAIPLDWLQQVHRNIFLSNGFQRNLKNDLDIVSVLLREEEEVEAVQIQLAESKISLMIGEEMFEVVGEESFQEIPTKALNVQFVFGNLDAEQEYHYTLDQNTSVYIQSLSGRIFSNGFELKSDNGLAITGCNALKINAVENSKVLIMTHAG